MNSSDLTFSTLHFLTKNSVSILSGSPSRRPSDSEVVTGGFQCQVALSAQHLTVVAFLMLLGDGEGPRVSQEMPLKEWHYGKQGRRGLKSPSQETSPSAVRASVSYNPSSISFPPQNSNVLLSTCNSVCVCPSSCPKRATMIMRWHACSRVHPTVLSRRPWRIR